MKNNTNNTTAKPTTNNAPTDSTKGKPPSASKEKANAQDPKASANVKGDTSNPANVKGTVKPATNPVANAKQIPVKGGKNAPIVVIEEEVKPPPVKEKNIERFIHVTTYNDIEALKTLKELFESINQTALSLKSVKEVYTNSLTQEEQEDNNLDYISGFQIIDSTMRITIVEGIANKAMKTVKEKLPKLNMNTNEKKIFANSKILFNERLYSKFNLCLKFIKLRSNLFEILTTADIYLKSAKYNAIFSAFMNMGSILKAPLFESIADSKLFPTAESLLMLERKYADILNDADLTGINTEPKKKQKVKIETSLNTTNLDNISSNVNNTTLAKDTAHNTTRVVTAKETEIKGEINKGMKVSKRMTRKDKTDSINEAFDKSKKSREKDGKEFKKTHEKNLSVIRTLNANAHTDSFCQRVKSADILPDLPMIHLEAKDVSNRLEIATPNLSQVESQNGSNGASLPPYVIPNVDDKIYLYSQSRKNYYADYVDKLREKYTKDKHNFYTYSMDYLTLSFPLIKNSNAKYDEFLENKKVLNFLKVLEMDG